MHAKKRDLLYCLRLSEDEKARFTRAADAEGLPLAQWLRRVALAAAPPEFAN